MPRYLFLSTLWGVAGEGHALIIFYNVPNWYASGWDQIRYQTPYDAFAAEWGVQVPRFSGCLAYELLSVAPSHVDVYEDGDVYVAHEATYN